MNDLDICRQAILNEEEGAAFYSLAAEKTSNDEAREAFNFLIEEELKHSAWLRSLYEHLVLSAASTNLEWNTLEEINFNREAELKKKGKSPEIFASKGSNFRLGITDMAVFAAGALIEKASIAFYKDAVIKAKSEDAKKLFEKLIDWEYHHLNELNAIHEALSKEWLDQQEFTHSPKL